MDKKGERKENGRKERKWEKRTEERGKRKKKGLSFLSKIYKSWVVGFRRSKRQSQSTQRELGVGTKIWEFRQNLRGREFSYLDYF